MEELITSIWLNLSLRNKVMIILLALWALTLEAAIIIWAYNLNINNRIAESRINQIEKSGSFPVKFGLTRTTTSTYQTVVFPITFTPVRKNYFKR